MTLFDDTEEKFSSGPASTSSPLADRMRPENLDEFMGQQHLTGPGKILRRIIEEDRLVSIIFWGPPGCGKTTLARIIANKTKSRFISYSAVISGIKQIKDVMEIASYELRTSKRRTILFIDEIHRFNKAQQDAFLPYVENGTIILIGATTENPSFEVISALISRCKVFVLYKLSNADISTLIKRALSDKKRGLGNHNIEIDDRTVEFISEYSDGDSRIAYNILELAAGSDSKNFIKKNISGKNETSVKIDIPLIENIIQKHALLYDKNGEEHFNLISALHKSMRGSDPDASAYWTLRMIEAGEDPLYILRRMSRFASEDIGLADPNAMGIVIAAKDTFEFIGPPEGYLAIIEASIYLSMAPKSNSLYAASGLIQEDIKRFQSLPVPYHIRNAPTRLMKEIGYSKGYMYPHNYHDAIINQKFLPERIQDRTYYHPTDRGFELELKKRLENIARIKKQLDSESKNKPGKQ
ncbi:MAG: replication-associated recombination protein A [Actinobacteria bacterium]|nr:replication-associated recombination protein A [Actinomycetota bacterium]